LSSRQREKRRLEKRTCALMARCLRLAHIGAAANAAYGAKSLAFDVAVALAPAFDLFSVAAAGLSEALIRGAFSSTTG
jgi:hypothetical protein